MQVLDKGFIELVDCLGSDLTIVNAARTSFSRESSELVEKDARLIDYLARNRHISPFYHAQLQFRVRAPISVHRQWEKHKIGTAMNTESTRYIEVHDDFYLPDVFRAQSRNNKQGSDGALAGFHRPITEVSTSSKRGVEFHRATDPVEVQGWCRKLYRDACFTSFQLYRELLDAGVAKEQAREVLPLCTYVSFVWTASLAAVAHFIKLRDDDHAQQEIREYAQAMRCLTEQRFPVSLAALDKYGS